MLHLLHPMHLKEFQQLQYKSFVYSVLYGYYALFRTQIIVQKCAHPILHKSTVVTSHNDATYIHKGYRL